MANKNFVLQILIAYSFGQSHYLAIFSSLAYFKFIFYNYTSTDIQSQQQVECGYRDELFRSVDHDVMKDIDDL